MRQAARPLQATARALAAAPSPSGSRAFVQIPHPDLDSPNPRHFALRTFEPLPSMAHTLAVVRAAEKRLGSVLSVGVPRDVDTLQAGKIILVTTLLPVNWSGGDVVLEIPAPVLSTESKRNGGITLDDVTKALDPEGKDKDKARPIRFRLEVARTPPRPRRTYTPRTRWASQADKVEDDAIARALERFGGGFFGGMDGLAERFGALKIEKEVKEEAPVMTLRVPKLVEKEVIEPQSAVIEEEVVAEEVEVAREEGQGEAAAPPPRSRAEKLADKAMKAAAVNARLESEAKLAAERSSEEPEAEAEAESAQSESQQGKGDKKMFGWFRK